MSQSIILMEIRTSLCDIFHGPRDVTPEFVTVVYTLSAYVAEANKDHCIANRREPYRRKLARLAAVLENPRTTEQKAAAMVECYRAINVPPDSEYRDQTLADTIGWALAQWAARDGGLATEAGRRAMAEGLRFCMSNTPVGRGSDTAHDARGGPRGKLLCAVAAIVIFDIVKGKRPARNRSVVLELASLLWRLAGAPRSLTVEGETIDDDADFERHIRAALSQTPPSDRSSRSAAHAEAFATAYHVVEEVVRKAGLENAYVHVRRRHKRTICGFGNHALGG